MTWRYIAVKLNGDGTETLIDPKLPLTGVEEKLVLNNADEFSATLSPDFKHLRDDNGRRLIRKWSTAIYFEEDEIIRGGGIVVDLNEESPGLGVEIQGFAGYPNGMPYTGSWFDTDIDPLDVYRQIWDHLQSQPGGNLGVEVDDTSSPVRTGKEVAQGEFDTENGPISFEYEPATLRWYEVNDLSEKVQALVTGTPFEFREHHEWAADHSKVLHRIRLGYPTIGARRHDIRAIIGETIAVPELDSGEEFASHVLGLGAGEGSAMLRADVYRPGEDRIRRVHVHEDKQAQTAAEINRSSQGELLKHHGASTITGFTVAPHHRGLFLSVFPGDEVRIVGDTGGTTIDQWVKITDRTRSHDGDGDLTFSCSADATIEP